MTIEIRVVERFLAEQKITDQLFKQILIKQAEYGENTLPSFSLQKFLDNNTAMLYSQYTNQVSNRQLPFSKMFSFSFF